MPLNLTNIVIDYLKSRQVGEQFTSRQIAEWIANEPKFSDDCREKKENSKGGYIKTDEDLLEQLIREIGARIPTLQKKYPEVKTTEGRPRKLYYSPKSEGDEAQEVGGQESVSEDNIGQSDLNEHALYPLLSKYLWEEWGVFSKRINEKCSSNKRGPNGNRWLHPDVVGMQDLGEEWHQEVRDCVNHYSDKRTKLWSFEVKKMIDSSNVRQYFFQAVSNSSWANLGFLVASEIKGGDAFKELSILSAAFGIGFIKLDVDNPTESRILIPARERDEINWDMVNRLAKENSDFLKYVKLVKQFYQTGEVKEVEWDVPEMMD